MGIITKIKNTAKTAGKYALKGLKFPEKDVLSVTELISKSTGSVAKNRNLRSLITRDGIISATVNFPEPSVTLTDLKSMTENCNLGQDISAVEALMNTFKTSENIMQSVMEVAMSSKENDVSNEKYKKENYSIYR